MSSALRSGMFLVVLGLPPHYDWQRMKDQVRAHTDTEPGRVAVFRGRTGLVESTIKVKTDGDAVKLYRYLTSNCLDGVWNLIVHRWDDSASPARCVDCNCAVHYPGIVGHLGPAPNPTMATPYARFQQAFMPPETATQLGVYNWGAPAPSTTTAANVGFVSVNGYQTASGASLVNTSNGIVKTEQLGIFIKDLDYSVTEEDIADALRKVGRTRANTLHLNKTKGCATVQFLSEADATNAIKLLDGKQLKGRRLKVRRDKNSTTIKNNPLVVSGNQRRRA